MQILFSDRTWITLRPINDQAPLFTGLPKVHKDNVPVKPLINYTTAPGYGVSKKLEEIIKSNIVVENYHNIFSTLDFINKTKDLKIAPQYKLLLDIVNLYTNIPIQETLEILKENLNDTNKLGNQKNSWINYINQSCFKAKLVCF